MPYLYNIALLLSHAFIRNDGCISSSSETWKFHWLSQIWPWRSRSIAPQTLAILTKLFCTFGQNLVILAWMGGEL